MVWVWPDWVMVPLIVSVAAATAFAVASAPILAALRPASGSAVLAEDAEDAEDAADAAPEELPHAESTRQPAPAAIAAIGTQPRRPWNIMSSRKQ
jgi:N-acetylmuramic acid 6-phosphate (MurNAc-6-P) etherase